jgi:response regulator RpfG family c-di-GMP phosphodiesterase
VVGVEREAKSAEVVPEEAGPAAKARILVVDDEPAITQFLSRVLEELDVKLPDMGG